ncbi:carbon storage regulator [bacterium]|nr:carbon storage regulator [bacterium]
MLVVTRKPGEKIVLGQNYLVEVVAVERGVVKVALNVDQPVTLMPGRIEVDGSTEPGQQSRVIQVSRKVDDSVVIGTEPDRLIEILIVSVKGEAVRIGVKAPRDVQVYREEVYEEIRRQNIAAAQPVEINPEGLGGLMDRR